MFALFRARSILTFSALTSLLLSACSPDTEITETAPTLETQAGLYAFENVNVIPMDREHVLNNQTVVVRDGRSEETRLNSSHVAISYAVFCLKKKKREKAIQTM